MVISLRGLRKMRRVGAICLLVLWNAASAQIPQPSPVPVSASNVLTAPGPGLESMPGGMPVVHDPSTVIQYRGRYYVYSTGRGIPMLSSPDKVHWTRLGSVFAQIPERVHAAVPKNDGMNVWAPDIIRVGTKFYLYYAVSSWGSFRSVVALANNASLDPTDPSYKWIDQGVVVDSDGVEEMNAIDPGVVLAPDGTMWLCYGSYHGSIKVLQLDPATGLALAGSDAKAGAVAIARESEAAELIHHAGYFFLFVNHGSCCQGKKSEYNIRVGRSRSVTGPYLDKHGTALTAGGGSLFLAAHDHRIGPGHFGRLIDEGGGNQPADGPGMEQFSLHYEADLTNGGRPTLGIRPLLWSADDWPVAGDAVAAGTFQIVSEATEDSLGSSASGLSTHATLTLRRYLGVEDQQWSIEPAGDGFYKLSNLGTKTPLDTDSVPNSRPDTGEPGNSTEGQRWRLDQLTDGSYRICREAANRCLTRTKDNGVALTSSASDDDHRWLLTSP